MTGEPFHYSGLNTRSALLPLVTRLLILVADCPTPPGTPDVVRLILTEECGFYQFATSIKDCGNIKQGIHPHGGEGYGALTQQKRPPVGGPRIAESDARDSTGAPSTTQQGGPSAREKRRGRHAYQALLLPSVLGSSANFLAAARA
jgi:hypothetical protein